MLVHPILESSDGMRHGIDLKPNHKVKEAGKSRKSGPELLRGRNWFPSLEYPWPRFDDTVGADLVEPAGIEPATSSLQS